MKKKIDLNDKPTVQAYITYLEQRLLQTELKNQKLEATIKRFNDRMSEAFYFKMAAGKTARFAALMAKVKSAQAAEDALRDTVVKSREQLSAEEFKRQHEQIFYGLDFVVKDIEEVHVRNKEVHVRNKRKEGRGSKGRNGRKY
jgi:predicted  nucleic acid-binding Zn-ribbon protein